MTDFADFPPAPPPPSPPASPSPKEPGLLLTIYRYLMAGSLPARAVIMAALTLALTVPLGLIGGVIADRQNFQKEAAKNIVESWGGPQTLTGPMLVLPYRPAGDAVSRDATLTLLPERLTIDARILPEQRRRGLFAMNVYATTIDVVAEFQTKAIQDILADGRRPNWQNARLEIGVTEPRSIDAGTIDVNGQIVEWTAGAGGLLSSLRASLGATALASTETITVRFQVSLAGSTSFAMTPLGRRTEATITSPWPSPSFTGRYLPTTQSVGSDGFHAKWTTSHLGRPYSQLWDSASSSNDPAPRTVIDSSFGVTLLSPIDAYRETDRAIKYGILFIGLTLAAGLLVEMAAGTRPHAMQYVLIGLALCVFYLLLLSLSEQMGFALAYLISATAVVVQATIYSWTLHRRRGPALAFGAVLAGLYGGLYSLLQLEDVALLAGSLMLFAVLSLAMWFTRNLHQTAPV
jgi:inner membrane protein